MMYAIYDQDIRSIENISRRSFKIAMDASWNDKKDKLALASISPSTFEV